MSNQKRNVLYFLVIGIFLACVLGIQFVSNNNITGFIIVFIVILILLAIFFKLMR